MLSIPTKNPKSYTQEKNIVQWQQTIYHTFSDMCVSAIYDTFSDMCLYQLYMILSLICVYQLYMIQVYHADIDSLQSRLKQNN